MRRLALLVAVLVLALAAPALAQSDLDAAGEALKSDPVYVDPDAEAQLSDSDAEELRTRITDADAGPMYVAVMPRSVVNEAGGSIGEALTRAGRATWAGRAPTCSSPGARSAPAAPRASRRRARPPRR